MFCALWLILESPSCLLFSFLWKDAKYVSSELEEANHAVFSQSWMKEQLRSVERCISQKKWKKKKKEENFQVDHRFFCSFYVSSQLLGQFFL